MEKKSGNKQKQVEEKKGGKGTEAPPPPPPSISPMEPVTRNAYGGGMYGAEEAVGEKPKKRRASKTQSADGPDQQPTKSKHQGPPSTGDRDTDITGQSYIQ